MNLGLNFPESVLAVIGLCAVISPMITTFLDHRFQLKMRKLDLEQRRVKDYNLHKREIFENFLRCAGECVMLDTNKNVIEYGDFAFQAYIYAPESVRPWITQLSGQIRRDEFKDAFDTLERISQFLVPFMEKL